MNTKTVVCGLIAAAGFAMSANATVIATFNYTDLDGSYDHGAGKFSAVAQDSGAFQSAGDVTRLLAPGGTAQFEPGFINTVGGNFTITISVFNIVGLTADGAGSFEITDIDGDKITGDINGNWLSPGAGIVFFNGLLSNVQFTAGGDGDFKGSGPGSFDITDLAGIYSGALVQLFTRVGGGFFNSSFSGVSALVSGDIVPAPGTLALLGLGGLAAIRRRR